MIQDFQMLDASLRQWVDLRSEVSGVFLSQLQPTGDRKVVEQLAEFEKTVYASLSKA